MRNVLIISVMLCMLSAGELYGQFTLIGQNMPGTFGSFVSFADYNRDDDLDMVITGSIIMSGQGQTYFYDNLGAFSFQSINPPFIDVYHSFIDWGDYNNDGILDAVVCGLPYYEAEPVTKVYKGLLNGQFIEIPQFFTGADNASAEWGDYNNDGKMDLIVTGSLIGGYNNPCTKLYRNEGNNVFSVVNAGLPNIDYGSVHWIDYDQDGDLDLSFCGTLIVDIYRNDGNNTFTQLNPGFTPLRYGDSAWGDFDNDGDDDFIYCGQTAGGIAQTKHYRNDGNGIFTSIPINIPGHHSGSMLAADWNNDGWLDLLICGSTDAIRLAHIYKNNENGTFTQMSYGFATVSSAWAQWGDLNNDRKLDVALSGYTGDDYVTRVYRNDSPSVNTPPQPPSLSFNPITKLISFIGATDAETPLAGLRYDIRIGTSPGASDVLSPCAAPNGYRRNTNSGRRNMRFEPQPGVVYYAAAQSIDAGLLGSVFGPEIVFTINGMAAVNVVSGSPLNFGQCYYQHLSEPQTLVLVNSGYSDLIISSTAFHSAESMFQLDSSMPALPWVIQPSQSLQIPLRILPDRTGTISDSLFIYNTSWNFPRLAIRLNATASYAPPSEVGHLYIETVGWDAVLTWDEVTTNVLGDPLIPDRYVVLFSEDNDPNHFWFLASTVEPEFVHYEVALFSPAMFYKVKAVKFYREEQFQRYEALLQTTEKLSWERLKEAIDKVN